MEKIEKGYLSFLKEASIAVGFWMRKILTKQIDSFGTKTYDQKVSQLKYQTTT